MRGWALYIIQGVENRRDLLVLYRDSMIHCRLKAGTASYIGGGGAALTQHWLIHCVQMCTGSFKSLYQITISF